MNQQEEKGKQIFFIKKTKMSLLMFALFLSLCFSGLGSIGKYRIVDE